MEFVAKLAEGFMSLFSAGGETFMGWVTGIIPTLVCLMTAVNSIIKLVGVEKVERFAQKITKYAVLRYTLLLDGCHIFEVHVVQRIENIIVQICFFKFHLSMFNV